MLKVVDSAVPIACWSCSVAHNDSTLFCPHCSKIQPASGDFFQVFSLGRGFQVDLPPSKTSFTASAASCTPTASPVPPNRNVNGAWQTRR